MCRQLSRGKVQETYDRREGMTESEETRLPESSSPREDNKHCILDCANASVPRIRSAREVLLEVVGPGTDEIPMMLVTYG